MSKKKHKRILGWLLAAAVSLMSVAPGYSQAAPNEEESTETTQSYCAYFYSRWDVPEKLYYEIYDANLLGDEAEEDEISMIQTKKPGDAKVEAERITDNAYAINFDEEELKEGKLLWIYWRNDWSVLMADKTSRNEYEVLWSYDDWCRRKNGVQVTPDGTKCQVVDYFYGTSTNVNVRDGYAVWKNSNPFGVEWTVTVYPVRQADEVELLSGIRDQIFEGGKYNGTGEYEYSDTETIPYYFEKTGMEEPAYMEWDETAGSYKLNVDEVILNHFNNSQEKYFIGVYSKYELADGDFLNQSGTSFYYKRDNMLYGVSASLSGNFVYSYYVSASDEAKYAEDLHMRFIVDGKEQTAEFDPEYGIDENGLMRFDCSLGMRQLAAPVQAYLCYSDYIVDFGQSSVKEYLDDVLEQNRKNGSYREYIPVINSLLNYAGYTQKYFDYDTDNMLNAGLYTEANDPVQNLSKDAVSAAITEELTGETENEDMVFVGASLVCKTNTSLKLYFEPKQGLTPTDLAEKYVGWINCQAERYTTLGATSKLFYFRMDNFAVTDFSKDFHIRLEGNDGNSLEMHYNPLVYVKQAMESGDQELVDLCKALYLYYKAADDLTKSWR